MTDVKNIGEKMEKVEEKEKVLQKVNCFSEFKAGPLT